MVDLTPDWIYLHSAQPASTGGVPGGPTGITIKRLSDRTARIAGGFADLGVSRGDRVATLLRSQGPLLEILLACARIGAVLVPLDPRLSEMDLSMVTADSAPLVLVYERALVAGAWAAAGGADCVLVSVDDGTGNRSQYDALLEAEPVRPSPVYASHPWVLLYHIQPGQAPGKSVLSHGAILADSIRAALAWASSGRSAPPSPPPLVRAGRFNVCMLASLMYGSDEISPTSSGARTSAREEPPPPCSAPVAFAECSSCSVSRSSP